MLLCGYLREWFARGTRPESPSFLFPSLFMLGSANSRSFFFPSRALANVQSTLGLAPAATQQASADVEMTDAAPKEEGLPADADRRVRETAES
jgi:hypothetical protein